MQGLALETVTQLDGLKSNLRRIRDLYRERSDDIAYRRYKALRREFATVCGVSFLSICDHGAAKFDEYLAEASRAQEARPRANPVRQQSNPDERSKFRKGSPEQDGADLDRVCTVAVKERNCPQ